MKVSIIKQAILLNCPHCDALGLEAGENYFKYVGQKNCQYDGDSLILDPYPEFRDKSHYASFGKWYCYCCEKPYLTLHFKGILAKVDEAFKWKYFLENENRGNFTNYLVNAQKEKWIISRFETDNGVMLDSTLGPYPKFDSLENKQEATCKMRFDVEEEIYLLRLGKLLFRDPVKI